MTPLKERKNHPIYIYSLRFPILSLPSAVIAALYKVWKLIGTHHSLALTGLARKNNATQAKAWAEFSRPFGPKPPSNPTGSWAMFPRPFGPLTAHCNPPAVNYRTLNPEREPPNRWSRTAPVAISYMSTVSAKSGRRV